MVRLPRPGLFVFLMLWGCVVTPNPIESVPSAPLAEPPPEDQRDVVVVTRVEIAVLVSEHEAAVAYIHDLEEANLMQLKIIDRLKSSKNCS
jgi:hypothetical protein